MDEVIGKDDKWVDRSASATLVKSAFAEVTENLGAQHMRLKLAKAFGNETAVDRRHLHKKAFPYPFEKPIFQLLQELPAKIVATVMSGPEPGTIGRRLEGPSTLTLGDLVGNVEDQKAALVIGHKAKLFLITDSAENVCFVRRTPYEPPVEPTGPKHEPKKLTRKQRRK